jgi:transcriptional regulator with XRE-family HTH domain
MREWAAFGRRLRELREAAGLSQRELARQVKVSHGLIHHFERGNRRPSEELVGTLSRLLGGDTEELGRLAGYVPPDALAVILTHPAAVRWLRAAAAWNDAEWERRCALEWGTV